MILSVFTLFVILSLGRAQIQVSAEKNFSNGIRDMSAQAFEI